MKCIYCGNDSKYKDRTNRQCPACGKSFAFEPQKKDPFTDTAFKSAIDAVSAHGQMRWGGEHLYYDLCRRLRRRTFRWTYFVVLLVLGAFVLGIGGAGPAIFILVPVWFVAWLLLRRYGRPSTVRLAQQEFDSLWNRWIAVHGSPPGLIVRKSEPARERPKEADIGDYSFDRAVICDRARTVDLLIANNFHFENNCAVLSVGGYPPGPFETVRRMLKRNPSLQVFVLHDASVAGSKLAHHVANDPEWFKGLVAVTDIGLRPRQSGPFEGLFQPAPSGRPPTALEGLRADELEWLSKYVLELAAIRPEQILKRLFKAINRREESAAAGGASPPGVIYDDDSFGSNATDSNRGADSFG